jgi:hypothetical protein
VRKLSGWLFAIVAALVLFNATPGETALASRAGRDRALDSLVQVIVHTRFGTTRRCSGFMFSTNGHVATAFHVVSDAESISVFHPDHGVYEVGSVRRLSTKSDVAILELTAPDPPRFGGAPLGDHRLLKVGDSVHVLHNPAFGETSEYDTQITAMGYPKQLTGGFITERYASDLSLIEVKGPFDSGSAGGIICNDMYEVVGLLVCGDEPGTPNCAAHAMVSAQLAPLLLKTYDSHFSELQTEAKSDADFFDRFMGPAARPLEFSGPMTEGYIAWFAPMHHAQYSDAEFTHEINDKIDKNWFYTAHLIVDGRPLREWSASRFYVLPAAVGPWDWTDTPERYIHFDADSLFSKRIYKNRDIEERIMTRHILAMPLEKGDHTLQYENKGANYLATGIKRKRVTLASAQVSLIDITGLSLVSMILLPNPPLGTGDGKPVRYELERRPYNDKELNWSIRKARLALKP